MSRNQLHQSCHKESNDIRSNTIIFEGLFKENFKTLCTFCQLRFGFEPEQAKDIVHTTFLKLWETQETFQSIHSIKHYLYKMVANICFDMIRHKRVREQHDRQLLYQEHEEITGNCFEGVELKQLVAEIDQAIAGLPTQMRKVFTLRNYEGMKYAEIAHHLDISVKTVETQMSRALVKIRQKLVAYLILLLIFTLFYMKQTL